MGTDGQDLTAADAVIWYDANARDTVERHEAVNPAAVNAWLEPFLPRPGGLIADVGAGAGRDAAWLAGKGYEVVAVEPSAEMRRQAEQLGRTNNGRIRWMKDRMPGLDEVHRRGLIFDFILVNAAKSRFRFRLRNLRSLPGNTGPTWRIPARPRTRRSGRASLGTRS
jgi:SAM-dependent methyltransferase